MTPAVLRPEIQNNAKNTSRNAGLILYIILCGLRNSRVKGRKRSCRFLRIFTCPDEGKGYSENTKKPATSFPNFDPNGIIHFMGRNLSMAIISMAESTFYAKEH